MRPAIAFTLNIEDRTGVSVDGKTTFISLGGGGSLGIGSGRVVSHGAGSADIARKPTI